MVWPFPPKNSPGINHGPVKKEEAAAQGSSSSGRGELDGGMITDVRGVPSPTRSGASPQIPVYFYTTSSISVRFHRVQ